jgi:uncharacterized protein YlxW (UPF0749 family)
VSVRQRLVWRALVPVTVAAAALLLVTSAVTARGTDLRSSRTQQVSQLIAAQQRTIATLTRQEDRLRADISAATARAGLGDRRIRAARSRADALASAAGLTAVTGPSVTVSLDDVPRADQQRDLAAGASPDDLVIHQQDVQGVVNALWAGGAEAMTLMGQRVVSTTAVRCVGNTLLLHGQVFSPPFVVTAVGDPGRLRQALTRNTDVQVFLQYVAAYGLRYHVSSAPRTTLPPYTGPLELTHAKALP